MFSPARLTGGSIVLTNRGFVRIVAAWGAIIALAGCAPWIALRYFPLPLPAVWAMVCCTALGIEYARQVWLYFRHQRPADAAAVMGLGTLAIFALMYGGFLPTAPFLRISPRVAEILHAHGSESRHAMMIDYKEDSLPWYEGGTIRKQRENDYLEKTAPLLWPKYLVLTREIWDRTPAEIQQQWEFAGEPVHGWAYSDGGRVVDVIVIRRRG